MSSTDIEKENLEAHVELCAERYKQLESRIAGIDKRLENVEEHLVAIRDTISHKSSNTDKQFITIGTSVLGILLTAVIGLLVHLATK
jgi:predicted  nucleic acid-binding Zn-ribbon protein